MIEPAMARLLVNSRIVQKEDDLNSRLEPLFSKIATILSCDGLNVSGEWSKAQVVKFVEYWTLYPLNEGETCAYETQVPKGGAGWSIFRSVRRRLDLCEEETNDFIERLKEFCLVICPSTEVSEECWEDCRMSVMFESLMGSLTKTFKFEINRIFGIYFSTDIPAAPKYSLGKMIFPRPMNVFFKNILLHRKNRKDRHMSAVYSLFQGLKKGLLPIRPDAVDQSLLDHKKALTRHVPLNDKFDWFCNEILNKEFRDLRVKPRSHWNTNVLKDVSSKVRIETKRKTFSNHSTICGLRSDGGQLRTGLRLRDLTNHQFLLEKLRLPQPDEFMGFVESDETWISRATGDLLFRNRELCEVRGQYLSERELYEELKRGQR